MTMEKVGVQNQDLINELQAEYQELKEKEASLIKTGSAPAAGLVSEIQAITAKINQLTHQEVS